MLSPLHPEQAVAFFLSLIGLCRFLCLLISQSVRASDDVHQADFLLADFLQSSKFCNLCLISPQGKLNYICMHISVQSHVVLNTRWLRNEE